MKKIWSIGLCVMCMMWALAGCGNKQDKVFEGATVIELADDQILVGGKEISCDSTSTVYAAKDIVYYPEGKDFTFGEGTKDDEHSLQEAEAHTVVHITKAGEYVLSGKLSAGQIAVDLGEDAKEDPEAIVTLILNGVDINCSVAPAVIFYNVYECGSDDVEAACAIVDTKAAGANVLIVDDTVNHVSGSYVARIYKSYELNEAGTEVVDSKKLHKYDAAFYSKMSMNINGDVKGTGELYIQAENEGLDSELHLTINGGNINIVSGNDGINTNEDEVSVTTVNGGSLTIRVSGVTGEGDGIDSNGWLVINGGTVIAEACSFSGDAGIDSDMGIHINGGTVIATGNMLDRISESTQNFAVFSFISGENGGANYVFKNTKGKQVLNYAPENDFSYLLISSPELETGVYTLRQDDLKLSVVAGNSFGGMMPGGMMPEGEREMSEGMQIPGEKFEPGMMKPEGPGVDPGMMRPEGGQGRPQGGFGMQPDSSMYTDEFEIVEGANFFSFVAVTEN